MSWFKDIFKDHSADALSEMTKRAQHINDGWNDAESRLGDALAENRLLSAQLDTANDRLARIAALETPNAAHGVKKAAAIARGEL